MRQLLALLLVVGFLGVYFWQIVAIAALVLVVWARDERAAALIARADQQHTWALGGDLRGTFGESYQPLP
jgi:hypothetical protein